MKHYLIYLIRNIRNNMIYVGKHITNNLNDGYMGSGLKIRDAIKMYGLENFEKTILFECESEDEMNAKEAEIVNEDFIARDDVYNIKLGGDGGWDEANKKSTNVGSNHFFKNKTTEEISEIGRKGGLASAKRIQNMSPIERQQYHDLRSKIAKMGFSLNFLGKKHTEETKKRMSASRTGKCIGKDNGSFGTMWICNDKTHESKKILKTDDIPVGWRKGRFCK